MDSISITYLNFNLLKSKSEALKITIEKVNEELKKSNISQEYFKKDNGSLNQVIEKLNEKIVNNEKLHQAEVLYYKEKSKTKFSDILLGVVIGGAVVGAISIL